jgi:pyruvate/2-oxoglutarate dehydrogenase complex dihydrolipoamide acyltransferase (E2) component
LACAARRDLFRTRMQSSLRECGETLMADINTGTDKAELKAMLKRAQQDHPMRCAVAQPKEGAFALLLADKTKQPRALSAELEKGKDFVGCKNVRWGTAYADENRGEPVPGEAAPEAIDPKLVIFLLNRPAPGLAKRLAKTLKLNRTGFTKVELRFEDGSPSEKEMEEEDEADAQAGAAAPAAAAAAPPPAAEAPALDAAALHRQLAELIPRIAVAAAGNDAARAKMMKMAGDANGFLKGGSLAEAATQIAALKEATEAAHAAPAAPAQAAAPSPLAKSRMAWMKAREKMEAEVEKLRLAILDHYKADGIDTELDTAYTKRVAPLLDGLDEDLADQLDDAAKEADPVRRAEHVAEAKATIARYQAFLAGDDTMTALEDNPFVPLTIRPVISATLTALSAAVH